MSLIVYETNIDWVPDPDFINFPPTYEYLAWLLGTSSKRETALWAITQVKDVPSINLVDLLPEDYASFTLDQELLAYGYDRSMYPKKGIIDVENEIVAQTVAVHDEVNL